MIDDDTTKLLRSLARLIEKPEIKAFEFSLITTLVELISAEAINIYEIRTLRQLVANHPEVYLLPVGYEDNPDEGTNLPLLLNQEPLFEECLSTQAMVRGSAGDPAQPLMRFLYPIVGRKGISSFLVIDAAQFVSRDHDLVVILLGFYHNYVSLLNDNQRDHLTGLLNRKSFDNKVMKMILSLSAENHRSTEKVQYYLAVFDIDHFKRVNDTLGHLMGDEVLLHFSQCMNQTFREYDALFRVGGEEFVVILRNVDAEQTAAIMERFRVVIETHYFPQVGQITTSIGVTSIFQEDLPVTIMDRADQALYYIKDHGRNQVAFYEQLVVDGKLSKKNADGEIELF